MSHTNPTSASSSNFRQIFNTALEAYEKSTKSDLLAHPLAVQLQACDSPAAILTILQQQVQELDQSRSSDERWSRWLKPTVNVLFAFSATLGEGVGLVFSPAKVIFAGVGVLLLAAKDVRSSQDTLVDLFERIENFFRRLETYTEVPLTTEMMDITMNILVEALGILAIATKEIKQSRTKQYLKKLVGRTDLEDALKRLDKLTHEEARMATAQILKVTHTVDDRVRGVDDKVASMDDRVRAVDDKVVGVVADGKEVKVAVQQAVDNIDQVKRTQLRESIYKWLSPPDPSTNHNTACDTYHKRTATWFFQGNTYKEWVSTGSLLWIHGKPGSGKSVLSSSIIQDIEAMCDAGRASMIYFYFDFRNADKQRLHDLLSSLLTQLSTNSDPRCDVLSRLYGSHDDGKKQPNDRVLTQCLKEMLVIPNQLPIYLIIDALDECPNTSGMPSDRERVLQLVKELTNPGLPNLHICVTSRPEVGIRHILEPLTSRRISLHDQTGQKEDIVEYVRSVVYSDSEQIMTRWRTEDKEFVIETLAERADGMYRWVFCQLEILRHCLPPSVRRTLDELPESLDETYERVLREIKKPNRDHARRLLQCLVVAIRPLRVEELAEVLAVDFDDVDGTPKLNTSWRWEDEEQALLSSCSSLIAIVNTGYSRVVQFSHFSVKEFLTSPRLSTSSGNVSRYHVALESAHIVLSQACLGVLLRLDSRSVDGDIKHSYPLAVYAAEYWVPHAQFGNAASHLRKAMESLFDPDKPQFAAWLQLYDIDNRLTISPLLEFTLGSNRGGSTPLYYAARCGFQDLAKCLMDRHPYDVNANGGQYVAPIVVALAAGHFHLAQLLYERGADVDVRGYSERTPLYGAAGDGNFEIAQWLLSRGADPNIPGEIHRMAPLHLTANCGHLEVARILLRYNADRNPQNTMGLTPLHLASRGGHPEVVRLLLEHDVDANTQDGAGKTPLHKASANGYHDVARLLLEHGVDVDALDKHLSTPLHLASHNGSSETVRMLIEHGANVDAKNDEGRTALQLALAKGHQQIAKLLSDHGSKSEVT